jgi:predicted MFS family arabinose efflux permease
MLHGPPFGYGSSVAGAFGLAGAAGALAAPVAGNMSDRRGPGVVTRVGALLVVGSFVAMAVAPGSLALLIAGTLIFDLGVQAALIAHQSIIYGLEPAARSRLNAVLIGTKFLGMSSGAALGAEALSRFGWRGVCTVAGAAALLALVVRLLPPPAGGPT